MYPLIIFLRKPKRISKSYIIETNKTMRKQTTTIIFDWAGVFCVPGEPFSHSKLPKETGFTVDEMGDKTQRLQIPYYKGAVTTNEFWKSIINCLKIKNISPNELSRAYLSSYSIYPEMLELAKNLKNKYKTAILSNLTEEMMDHITATHKVNECFKFTFFSNKIGLVKPDKEAFEYALKKINSTPRETIFVDDSKRNVEAAKKLGFDAFVFESPAQCKQELEKRGIKTEY